jgi:MSHA biogenesis protein MshJ
LNAAIVAPYDRLRTTFVQWRRAFDSRSRRERVLMMAAAVAAVWMLADAFWLAPAIRQWSVARARRGVAVTAVVHLNEETVASGDAEQLLRRDVARWRERVAAGERDLHALRATLVDASEMVPMLDRLLAQVGGLRLRSMRSLDRIEVGVATGELPLADLKGASRLYRQGIELVVEGSYADLLAYLRAIEAMPQQMLWGGLTLKVERSPKVVMSLRLYVVSEDRNWLEI